MTKRFAFTLAEVLLTLGVVGVVAMLTIPTLMTSIETNKLEKRKILFSARIDEAMAQMRVQERLVGYETADDFVDELSKYMKISERCDSSNLDQCFNFPIIDDEGFEYTVDYVETGDQITTDENTENYNSDNVGVIFADGTSAIINYNQSAEWLDPYTAEKRYGDQTLPSLTASQNISMIFDVNGAKGLSSIANDVMLFNAQVADVTLEDVLDTEGLSQMMIDYGCYYPEGSGYPYCPEIEEYAHEIIANSSSGCITFYTDLALSTLMYCTPQEEENDNVIVPDTEQGDLRPDWNQ